MRRIRNMTVPGIGMPHALGNFLGQIPGNAFIGVHHEHPGMLVADCREGGIALCGVVVECALDDPGALRQGNFASAILAQRIKHDDVVAPRKGVQTRFNVDFLVERQNQGRYTHVLLRRS